MFCLAHKKSQVNYLTFLWLQIALKINIYLEYTFPISCATTKISFCEKLFKIIK